MALFCGRGLAHFHGDAQLGATWAEINDVGDKDVGAAVGADGGDTVAGNDKVSEASPFDSGGHGLLNYNRMNCLRQLSGASPSRAEITALSPESLQGRRGAGFRPLAFLGTGRLPARW